MARNGSGTYSLPSGNPVVTGAVISSTWANNTLSDIATALTGSIAKDGQTSPTANMPMATYRHTGVGAAVDVTDYARADQAQNSSLQWLTTVSGADTITATVSPAPAAYAAGQTFRFISAGANTGAATLNVASLGAKAIKKNGTTALAAGDIPSGTVATVVYDGTNFQLNNVAPIAVPTGVVKGDGSTFSAATAGTDYAKPATASTWSASQRGTITTDNDASFDQSVTNNFKCTPTGAAALTFTNHTAGQSGLIIFINGSNYAITAAATTYISAADLVKLSATGTYLIAYLDDGTNAYCTVTAALTSAGV
jgi:hypothetical protein